MSLRWRKTRRGSSDCPSVAEIKAAMLEALAEYGVCTETPTTSCVVTTLAGDTVVTQAGDTVIPNSCAALPENLVTTLVGDPVVTTTGDYVVYG